MIGPEATSSSPDLERIRKDVDAQLAMVDASRPRGPITDADARTFDPTAVDASEVRLHSLHDAVLAMEELMEESEEDLGTAGGAPPVGS